MSCLCQEHFPYYVLFQLGEQHPCSVQLNKSFLFASTHEPLAKLRRKGHSCAHTTSSPAASGHPIVASCPPGPPEGGNGAGVRALPAAAGAVSGRGHRQPGRCCPGLGVRSAGRWAVSSPTHHDRLKVTSTSETELPHSDRGHRWWEGSECGAPQGREWARLPGE